MSTNAHALPHDDLPVGPKRTAALVLPKEAIDLGQQAIEIRRQGPLQLNSQEDYDFCAHKLGVVVDARKQIAEHYDESIQAAHQQHKRLLAMKAEHDGPLAFLETAFKSAIITFDRKKEQERIEAQRKLDAEAEEARKAEERVQLAAAKERGAGPAERAEIKRTIAATPAPTAAPTYERSSSVTTAANWTAEIDGLEGVIKLVKYVAENVSERLYLLEPDKLMKDHPNLNRLAKSQKDRLAIPGVRAVDKGRVSAR